MSPFEWINTLQKSGYLEYWDKARFKGSLNFLGDDKNKTFTISLTWKDKKDQSGEIFIPSDGIKRMYMKIVEFEKRGFTEQLGDQIYPP